MKACNRSVLALAAIGMVLAVCSVAHAGPFDQDFGVYVVQVPDSSGSTPLNPGVSAIVAAPDSLNPSRANFQVPAGSTTAQSELNAAIASLPSTGGRIVLLEGNFIVSAAAGVSKDNIVIEGQGRSTVIKVKDALGGNINIFENTKGSTLNGFILSNLVLDGNRANNSSGIQYGAALSNVASPQVNGVTFRNFRSGGLFLGAGTSTSRIRGNVFSGNAAGAVSATSSGNTVSSNFFFENDVSVAVSGATAAERVDGNVMRASSAGTAVSVGTSPRVEITRNVIDHSTATAAGDTVAVSASDQPRVTGNVILGNLASSGSGVYLTQSHRANISNNAIWSKPVAVTSSLSDSLSLQGNQLVSAAGIVQVSGSYDLFAGNMVVTSNGSCLNLSGTESLARSSVLVCAGGAGTAGIRLSAGNRHNVTSNLARRNGAGTDYGLLVSPGVTNSYIVTNDLFSSGAAANFLDSGTGTNTGTSGNLY